MLCESAPHSTGCIHPAEVLSLCLCRLTFSSFDTEPGFDTLWVLAVTNSLQDVVANLSGSLPALAAAGQQSLVVAASEVVLRFKADGAGQGLGWALTWQQGEPP